MELINDQCKIKAEILTPLSIGAGSESEWVNGVDYLVRGDKLYHLNLSKMVEAGVDMNVVASLFERSDSEGLDKMLGNRLPQVSDFTLEMPKVSSPNPIKSMLRNKLRNTPIIAGSSLKGAIRSVILSYLEAKGDVSLLGSMKDGTDFMRFIKVGDFDFHETGLVNSKIFNLWIDREGEWKGGWKHGGNRTDGKFSPSGFNTIYESLMPGMTGLGYISVSETQFKQSQNSKVSHPKLDEKKLLFNNPDAEGCSFIENLFYEINFHTNNYLARELHFFRNYACDKSDEIEDSILQLKKLCKQCMNEDTLSCVIKMSAGAGFHSITGDWQFDDYTNTGEWNNGKLKYKSRKIAVDQNKLSLMGFVKLTIDENF